MAVIGVAFLQQYWQQQQLMLTPQTLVYVSYHCHPLNTNNVNITEKFHLVELNVLILISSKKPKKLFTFDVSTSIRGLHQKKLVLGLLLPVLGATS